MTGDGEARRFFLKADEDLRALRAMGVSEDFSDEIFGFHAQQAVEKLLEAWRRWLDAKVVRTHDLDFLFGMLEDSGVSVPDAYRQFADLTDFAVMFRYEILELHRSLDRTESINLKNGS